MNFTASSVISENEKFYTDASQNNYISSISLAVCSILLSLGGCLVALQKSRCKSIKVCGSTCSCTRTLEDV